LTHSIISKTARSRLESSRQPYYHLVQRGLALGYRKPLAGPGMWVSKVYSGNGRYRVKNIALADDAQEADGEKVLAFGQALDACRRVSGSPAIRYTMADAMESYRAHLALQGRTAALDDLSWRMRAIVSALGTTPLANLTTKRLTTWRNDLARTMKPASANRLMITLKAALNHAWRNGDVTDDSAWRKVQPFPKATVARQRFLTVDECKALIAACNPDFKPMVQAALATGCRYGELCRLAVADFDARNGTLHIRTSKSGKPRDVILTAEGVALFKKLADGQAPDAFLLRHTNGEAWAPSHQQWAMDRACERAGIKGATFHTLRHTVASLSIMAGVPMLVLAKNLGHSSTKMIEQHYGHLAASYSADAIRKGAPTFE
jgi:integrase